MTATDPPTDLETLYATILVFGVLSAAVYLLVLKPLLSNRQQPVAPNAAAAAPAAHAARRNPAFNGGGATASSRSAAAAAEASSAVKGGAKCTRVPSHVSANSASIAVNGGSNLLVDGLVAFRHCKAAAVTVSPALAASSPSPSSDSIRKERARVLSRLLLEDSGVAGSPPSKGSTVVLAIPEQDVACDKLHRTLFLLATYYNLLLLVAVDPDFDRKRKGDILQRLRESKNGDDEMKVSSDVLPDHRIVLTSTVTGRVAFARQLQRIELVFDFDPEVKQLLGRFGHRVIVYGDGSLSNKGVSIVGQVLDS